jgi:hypothetical protein
VHFLTKFWKFKKTAFFRYVKRLGMTTVGMPGHGFTFPVEGIVPVIFSSMILPQNFHLVMASNAKRHLYQYSQADQHCRLINLEGRDEALSPIIHKKETF